MIKRMNTFAESVDSKSCAWSRIQRRCNVDDKIQQAAKDLILEYKKILLWSRCMFYLSAESGPDLSQSACTSSIDIRYSTSSTVPTVTWSGSKQLLASLSWLQVPMDDNSIDIQDDNSIDILSILVVLQPRKNPCWLVNSRIPEKLNTTNYFIYNFSRVLAFRGQQGFQKKKKKKKKKDELSIQQFISNLGRVCFWSPTPLFTNKCQMVDCQWFYMSSV